MAEVVLRELDALEQETYGTAVRLWNGVTRSRVTVPAGQKAPVLS